MAALSFSLAMHPAQAQAWPAKPVRVIMSYAGGSEPLVRLLDQKVSQALGQPVILDVQPGAGGSIGRPFAGVTMVVDGYRDL